MIEEAESLLTKAGRMGAIAAIGSRPRYSPFTRHEADWLALVGLYYALLALTNSPVVMINRAVAIAEVREPRAAGKPL
jgi:RNA polymerase sigma-70 factor, ECF subfamily